MSLAGTAAADTRVATPDGATTVDVFTTTWVGVQARSTATEERPVADVRCATFWLEMQAVPCLVGINSGVRNGADPLFAAVFGYCNVGVFNNVPYFVCISSASVTGLDRRDFVGCITGAIPTTVGGFCTLGEENLRTGSFEGASASAFVDPRDGTGDACVYAEHDRAGVDPTERCVALS